MECFIIENSAERKAELEDLLSFIEDGEWFQNILRSADREAIHTEVAFAHLPEELKNKIYRNMSFRNGGWLRIFVGDVESKYEKNSDHIQRCRTELISVCP